MAVSILNSIATYNDMDISQPGRDSRIDSIKYFSILLVIIGHVFSRDSFSTIPACRIIWRWIYIFHMPLFVFLSGYFSRKKDLNNYLRSIWRILEPLIVFQVLIRGMSFILTGSLSIREILTPWWVLWYLLSLFFWRSILQVLPDIVLQNAKLLIVGAFIVSLLAGYLPFTRFLSLQRTFSFMPFFFLGYCLRGKSIVLSSKYKWLSALFLVLTLIIPIFFDNYLGDLDQADPYGNPLRVCSRMLVFGLSIPMSVAFINICPKSSWTAKQGKLTMQYYIYHALIIDILLIRIINRFALPMTFWAAVAYSILIIAILGLCSYFPYFSNLTNPSSFFKRNQHNTKS